MTLPLHIQYHGPDLPMAISAADRIRTQVRFATRGEDGLISIPKWQAILQTLMPFRNRDTLTISLSQAHMTMFGGPDGAVSMRIHGSFYEYANNDPAALRTFLDRLSRSLRSLSTMPSSMECSSNPVRHAEQIVSIDTLDPAVMAAARSRRTRFPNDPDDTLHLSLPYPFPEHSYKGDIDLLSSAVRSGIEALPQAVLIHHDVGPEGINHLEIHNVDVAVSPPDDPVERMRLIAEIERRNDSPS